jgi:uncharacterized membrane protein
MVRLYHVTLFFLAPLFVIGGAAVYSLITRIKILPLKSGYTLVLATLILFHFFNTGLVYTLAGRGTSLALDYDRQLFRTTHHEDIAAATWLYAHQRSETIYIEDNLGGAPFSYADPLQKRPFKPITPDNLEDPSVSGYLHLRYGVLATGMLHHIGRLSLENSAFIKEGNRIFDNGSAIYQMP